MILKKHKLDVAFGANWTKVSRLDVRCEEFNFDRYVYILNGTQFDDKDKFMEAFDQYKTWAKLTGEMF